MAEQQTIRITVRSEAVGFRIDVGSIQNHDWSRNPGSGTYIVQVLHDELAAGLQVRDKGYAVADGLRGGSI